MKKRLLAIPLIAGAAWVGASYFAGAQSESVYDELLTQIEVFKPFTFEKESFNKGLTHSTATSVVRESNNPDAPVFVRLNHDINHAALRFDDNGTQIGTVTIKTTVADESNHPQFQQLRQYFTGDNLIEITSTAGIGGAIDSVIKVGAIEFERASDGSRFTSEQSTLELKTDGARTVAEGAIGQLTISDSSGMSFIATPSTLTADVTTLESWVYDYESLWSFDTLTLTTPELPAPTAVNDVKFGTAATPDGDITDLSGFLSFDSVSMGDDIPVETLPVTSGRLDVGIKNLNVAATKRYREAMNQIAVSAEDSKTLFDNIKGLMTRNLEVLYELQLSNSGGNADADYRLHVVGDSSNSGHDTIITARDLLNALEMDLMIKANKAALALTPALPLLDSLQAQRVLIDDGEYVIAKATLRDLTATLNADEFPLDQMLGGMLDVPVSSLLAQ